MSEVPEIRNGDGWVIMSHPDLKGEGGKGTAYAEVTQEAFDASWKSKGWKVETSTRATKSATKVGG